MLISYEAFAERAAALQARIGELCRASGRPADSVRVLPVTKTHPAEAAGYAARFGFAAVGENRVQEAEAKRGAGPAGLRWELIGHLQSNKARLAVGTFDRIQSVDSAKLVGQLEKAAAALSRTIPILLQVNAGNDPAKHGAEIADAPALLEAALQAPHLRVEGLMTIAPLSEDPAVARRTFAALRVLRDDLAARFGVPMPELSMGMSGDLEAAIAEGSTLVRVGTALFGER